MKLAFILFSIILVSDAYSSLRIATYNIRNFDYDSRSHTPTNKLELVQTIEQMNVDLLAVQEINNTQEFKAMIHKNFKGKFKTILTNCGGSHRQRLGFVYNSAKLELLNFNESYETVNPGKQQRDLCNNGSRPLAMGEFLRVETNEKITAFSVHLKSGGAKRSVNKRFQQLRAINNVIKNYSKSGKSEFIVMGDFNSTNYILKNKNYRKFLSLIRKMDMIDTTSDLSCSSYWWGGSNDHTQYPSTLDHILASKEIAQRKIKSEIYGHCKALNCESSLETHMGISFDEVSDHCPILTEIE